MKKKTLSALLFSGILLANVCAPALNPPLSSLTSVSAADTAAPSEFDYTVNHDGKGVTVTKYKGRAAQLIFPDKINALPITAIGDSAFSGNTTLTEITIPDTVTSIGRTAFWRCESLAEIHIPASVTSIGDSAFQYTPWFQAKRAENPLVIVNTILVDGALCEGVVTVPEGVTAIADMAFYCADFVEKVILPQSMTAIGDNVFEEATSLTEINIPETITAIGAHAFDHCIGLETLTIPAAVQEIGEDAFTNCVNLTVSGYTGSYAEKYLEENEIPFASVGTAEPVTAEPTDQIPYASPDDFKYTVSADGSSVTITKYTGEAEVLWIPKEIEGKPVAAISAYAFHTAGTLREVHIPDTVKTIGANAFDGCTKLRTIAIPASVTEIGSSAFYTGGTLSIIGEPDSYAETYAKQKSISFVSAQTVPGDLNGDNNVNLKDAVLLRRYIAGGWNVSLTETTADINKDGTVNLKDVVLLRRFIAGGWNVTL